MQHLHFVTGKGGVGKSTVAAALAWRHANLEGQTCLLVELENAQSFGSKLGLRQGSDEVQKTPFGFDWVQWTGSGSLRAYLKHLLKFEKLSDFFWSHPISRSLVEAAPGLKELALMGQATSQIRGHGPGPTHQVVVVDAYSTGHFLSLMRAPNALGSAVSRGPLGEQSRSMDHVLKNSAQIHYHIVTLDEDLPVQETLDLHSSLRDEFGVEAQIILNRSLHPSFFDPELRASLQYAQAHQSLSSQELEFLRSLWTLLERSMQATVSLQAVARNFRILPRDFNIDAPERLKNLASFLS